MSGEQLIYTNQVLEMLADIDRSWGEFKILKVNLQNANYIIYFGFNVESPF